MKRLADYQHHYECSTDNCDCPKAKLVYKDFDSFYDEFCTADVNWNLVVRWDVRRNDDGSHYCELPVIIKNLKEQDEIELLDYLQAHWDYLKDIWAPISRL